MSTPQDLLKQIREAVNPIIIAHMNDGPEGETLMRLCLAMATVTGTMAKPLDPKEFTQVVRALFGAKGERVEMEAE